MVRGRLPVLAATLLLAGGGCAPTGEDAGRLRRAAGTQDATAPPTRTAELPAALTEQRLDWSACKAPKSAQGDDSRALSQLPGGVTWECATMTVPLDYTDPDGQTIDIALVRARSRAQGAERLGSLLFNFGGPGGSGVATLPVFGQDYARLHERYDLVSFDPRGVGESEGLVCMNDSELDAFFAANSTPRTAAQERQMEERLENFSQRCEDAASDLLPHLTTTNTARDMDLIREVLGDELLNYFGVSYGTELGGVYAHHFPERVGRAVFDAVVDPTEDMASATLSQARGFDGALDSFLESCVQEEDCPLGSSPEEGRRTLTKLLERIHDRPLPTRDLTDRPLTHSLALSGVAQSLYSQDFWPFLTQGLEDALAPERPDGTVLQLLGDSLIGRDEDGTYTTLQSSLTAISCADSHSRYRPRDVRQRLPEFQDASPMFGEYMAWSLLTCTPWPVRGQSEHPEVSAPDARQILLVATTGDPATPYGGAQRMQKALGNDVGVLLTYESEGHGAYHSGNACIADTVDAYLLDGKVPEDGKTCE